MTDIDTMSKKGKRKHFFQEDYFKKIDSPEKAYFLGFILADGHIKEEYVNKKPRGLQWGSKDLDILEKFVKAVSGDIKLIKNEKPFYYKVTLNSRRLANDLIKNGILFKRKSYEQKYINTNYPLDFMRGLIDGDGWVITNKQKNGNYRIIIGVSGTKDVVDGFKREFNFFVTKGGSVSKMKGCNCYRFDFSTTNPETVMKIFEKIYSSGKICLERKKNKFNEFFNFLQNKPFISLTDYPKKISLFIPLPGCKKSCPWCFNSEFRESTQVDYRYIEQEVVKKIEDIDAIILGGGEPTLHLNKIDNLIKIAKENKIKLGIQTANINDYNVVKIRKNFNYVSCTINNQSEKWYSNGPKRILLDKEIIFENKIIYIPSKTKYPENIKGDLIIQQFIPGECLNPEYNKIIQPKRDEVYQFGQSIGAKYIITQEKGRERI